MCKPLARLKRRSDKPVAQVGNVTNTKQTINALLPIYCLTGIDPQKPSQVLTNADTSRKPSASYNRSAPDTIDAMMSARAQNKQWLHGEGLIDVARLGMIRCRSDVHQSKFVRNCIISKPVNSKQGRL